MVISDSNWKNRKKYKKYKQDSNWKNRKKYKKYKQWEHIKIDYAKMYKLFRTKKYL